MKIVESGVIRDRERKGRERRKCRNKHGGRHLIEEAVNKVSLLRGLGSQGQRGQVIGVL